MPFPKRTQNLNMKHLAIIYTRKPITGSKDVDFNLAFFKARNKKLPLAVGAQTCRIFSPFQCWNTFDTSWFSQKRASFCL